MTVNTLEDAKAQLAKREGISIKDSPFGQEKSG